MTHDSTDPRLADETTLQAIRRRIEEVAHDAPQLAKIALEAMVRRHNPDLKGSAQSAGSRCPRGLRSSSASRGCADT